MLTYQDLMENNKDEKQLMDFVKSAIDRHKSSDEYAEAEVADLYNRKMNKTIMEYQKLLYTMSGEKVPDNYSANYKIRSNFFNYVVTQEVQYLMGNGVSWQEENTEAKLGEDFDSVLQDVGENALVHGVSFGYWNFDHLECFSLLEFVPLFDEETGALKAGIRFWQIDSKKPLRATLYELDGYTEYIWNNKENGGKVLKEKQSYKINYKGTDIDGMEIVDGDNYPTFPIVPMYPNKYKQSEFIGMREQIDAYDLIKSGFANDLDDASQIYWLVSNAGGMDDVDLREFLNRLKTVRAATVDGNVHAESHTVDIPYNAREVMLGRLRNDFFENSMALDVKTIAAGAITATQIKASYEPLNEKTDKFEFRVLDFIKNVLAIAGIEDNATFTRSIIVNKTEEVGIVLQSAQFLPQDYITEKLLTIMGDKDRVDEILEEVHKEEQERFAMQMQMQGMEEPEGPEEEGE